MLRRKLFAYTIMFAAGIAAGFFIFEKSRYMEACGFIISISVAIMIPGSSTDSNLKKSKHVLLLFLMAGMAAFTVRHLVYEDLAASVSQLDAVTGTVRTVELKDDKVQLTVKPEGRRYGMITVSGEAGFIDLEDPYSMTGAKVSVRGNYKEISSADNPGCFDYDLYMKSKGVGAGFKAYSVEVVDPDTSLSAAIRRYLYKTRESFIKKFDERSQGFIKGVIFGDKSEIDEDTLKEFNNNSTGHILAVSGLHIGFLYGLLKALTGRKKTLPISFVIIIILMLYGEMTMWSPATIRACIVLTVNPLSVYFRRRSDLLTSVSLAALVILTSEPYQLFNSGFQMSFLALLGIAFLARPISLVTGEALGVMLAVQAAALPVTAYTFGRIDPLSILINIPVILLASVLVPLCIILLMMHTIIGATPSFGIEVAELISYAVIKINHILNFNGAFSFTIAGYGTMVLIAFYIIIFSISSEWMRIRIIRKDRKSVLKAGVLIMMPAIMLSACLYDRISDDEIVFVAVGQGDCTHIRAGDHNILIDGGGIAEFVKNEGAGSGKEGFNTGEKILMPYLLHEGVNKLDAALVTHLHADHYKGIEELSAVYPVDSIGIPVDYRGLVIETKSPVSDTSDSSHFYVKPETSIHLSDEVSIEVLWPVEVSKKALPADDPNEHNTVYLINYKGIKTIVTGDLLEEDELEMVKHYEGTDKLKCDILKVAHHGSKSSSSEEFLDAVSPSIAIIQCGRNNLYGHPHDQTTERLEERGILIYRTDINGAVGIDIHKNKIAVDLFKDMV